MKMGLKKEKNSTSISFLLQLLLTPSMWWCWQSGDQGLSNALNNPRAEFWINLNNEQSAERRFGWRQPEEKNTKPGMMGSPKDTQKDKDSWLKEISPLTAQKS